VSESLVIDGFGPVPVRRPGSAAELGGFVREAVAANQAVYPVGGRTMLDLGRPPTKPGFAVDTTGLSAVIDYPARDMTITVQAGIPLAKLQQTLAAENQWLPVDVPEPDRATIGGAIATNASGPRRFGYGTLRDYVIGISFITDEGKEVNGGGRVVKNVAGYDLMKLQTGALGTLGILTHVTLKVKPKPEESAAIVFTCGGTEAGTLLDLLHASKSRPIAVELLNPAAWQAAGVGPLLKGDWVIAAGFDEKHSTVAWQVSALLAELKSAAAKGVTELRGADVPRLWSAVTELQTRPESRFIWKASMLPSKIAGIVEKLGLVPGVLLASEALNGIAWVHSDQSVVLPEGDINWTIRRSPSDGRAQIPVWGRQTDTWTVMRHVKRMLDPNSVFNPGRLFADS
jgi:glycolate oxidase FAD binding subunit